MYIRRLSGLLKELKKIFRRRRKLGLSFVLLGVIVFTLLVVASQEQRDPNDLSLLLGADHKAIPASTLPAAEHDERDDLAVFLQANEANRQVEVYTIYICGEEKQTFGKLSSADILDLMNQHPDWQVGEFSNEQVVFYEYVEDLSEHCKQSAYIGIDEMDQLTLFEGLPNHEQVIRTFFQIDVEYLKTSLPPDAVESLYNGIRIRDLDQYRSVISTFSEFAVDAADQAAGKVIPE